ncbi:hypothetical protein K440DRAFT_577322, partial [Wilcoxina mikolae CBS 423.85]
MSEATSWVDCVVFAMAPLGILTAIVGAIRVGGPPFLKAIIGRARENRALAEVELMSSTSHEVCELWNGETIVRVMGTPQVELFIFLEGDADFDSATLSGWISAHTPRTRDQKNVTPTLKPPRIAPNISLNLIPRKHPWELPLAAPFGVLLQLGVLIYTGLLTYKWQWRKGSKPIRPYAFPLLAVGTIFLVIGMFMCSWVVEHSTDEETWKRKQDNSGQKLHLLWVQRDHVVSDQTFNAYVIVSQGTRGEIVTSRRTIQNNFNSLVAPVGTVIGIVGFFCQFLGLRAIHWSASIAQLSATILMTIVRAFIRRGMIERPNSQSVLPGYEMDWLATTNGYDPSTFWRTYG